MNIYIYYAMMQNRCFASGILGWVCVCMTHNWRYTHKALEIIQKPAEVFGIATLQPSSSNYFWEPSCLAVQHGQRDWPLSNASKPMDSDHPNFGKQDVRCHVRLGPRILANSPWREIQLSKFQRSVEPKVSATSNLSGTRNSTGYGP